MACASRDIIRTPGPTTNLWPLSCPDQLGPGSSSLPALIERKFTPSCDQIAATVALISCVLREVNKKRTCEAIFLFEGGQGGSPAVRKEHVTGLFAPAAAVFQVQTEIVLQNVIALRIAKLPGGAIDRPGRPL